MRARQTMTVRPPKAPATSICTGPATAWQRPRPDTAASVMSWAATLRYALSRGDPRGRRCRVIPSGGRVLGACLPDVPL